MAVPEIKEALAMHMFGLLHINPSCMVHQLNHNITIRKIGCSCVDIVFSFLFLNKHGRKPHSYMQLFVKHSLVEKNT